MSEKEKEEARATAPLDYMEELSEAYKAAFARRLAKGQSSLSEEKRRAIVRMQLELSRAAGKLALAFRSEEKKELARMIKESAEEALRAVNYDEEEVFSADPITPLPPAVLLTRAVMCANRSLNLLLRHRETDQKIFDLILSEISAIYAIAAIG